MQNSCGRTHTYTLHLCLELEMLRQKHVLATRCTLTTHTQAHTLTAAADVYGITHMYVCTDMTLHSCRKLLSWQPRLLSFHFLHFLFCLFLPLYYFLCFILVFLYLFLHFFFSASCTTFLVCGFVFFFLFSQGTPEYIFFLTSKFC